MPKSMKVIFIGASRFGMRCLEAAATLPGINIVGAVTAPKAFAISYRPEGVMNVLHADIGSLCNDRGVPCFVIGEHAMRDPSLLAEVERLRPDVFLVAGWYHLVPKAWRALAPAFGLHASLLPDYCGGAPLVWAMINGETRTGITLFQLADGVDDGPIVAQAETEIAVSDNIASLYARIEDLGVGLVREHLPRLADGTAALTPQDDARRRLVPQRSPEDGLIDWNWTARKVHDFVRAQTRPYPGAFFVHEHVRWTVWGTQIAEGERGTLGIIEARGEALLVGCGDGEAVELLELAIEGVDIALNEARRRLDVGGVHYGSS